MTSTLPAHYQHTTSTLPAPYQHHTSTIPAPYQHTTSTLPAHDQHITSTLPAQCLINTSTIHMPAHYAHPETTMLHFQDDRAEKAAAGWKQAGLYRLLYIGAKECVLVIVSVSQHILLCWSLFTDCCSITRRLAPRCSSFIWCFRAECVVY